MHRLPPCPAPDVPRPVRTLSSALALAALLVGCADDGSTDASAPVAPSGTVALALTDAPGDFEAYAVEVSSVTLHRADGLTVPLLESGVTIDFSEYVDLAEIASVADVPAGRYLGATVELDYADALLRVEAPDGELVDVGTVLDADGAPVDRLSAELDVGGRDGFVVGANRLDELVLDFDLAASNRVEFDAAGVPAVTVSPVLVAGAAPSDSPEGERARRVRGVLERVDLERGELELSLRPYRARFDAGARHGSLTLATDESTAFGELVGREALEALAAFAPGARALVAVRRDAEGLVASRVAVGADVPGDGAAVLRGVVAARDGDALTVRGLLRDGEGAARAGALRVELAPDTPVLAGFGDGLDPRAGIETLSVGQRLRVWGSLVADGDGGSPTLSTAGGGARLLPTALTGTVTGTGNALVLDLARLGGRDARRFDFAGTGTAPELDADPDAYEVDAGAIDLGAFAPGTRVRVRGRVRPFGTAPADFAAARVADLAELPATLQALWPARLQAGTAPLSVAGTVLRVDLASATRLRRLGLRGDGLGDEALAGTWDLAFVEGATLTLIERGSGRRRLDAGEGLAALDAALAGGAAVRSLVATGRADPDRMSVRAVRATVTLR